MSIGDAIVFLAMVAAWVFGVAVAILKGFGMLAVIGLSLFPPAAWVVLAMHVLA